MPLPKISLLISIFLMLISTLASTGQSKRKLSSRLDSLLSSKTGRHFSGVVLIKKGRKTEFYRSYGYSDSSARIPLNAEEGFVILSNSKQITACLILCRVDQGLIRVQSSIKAYLPKLTESWADSVTVHHLLNHTSGIVSIDKPLAFSPGTKFNYSNLNYILLGEILEATSRMNLADQFNSLLRKCGMKNSFFPTADNINTVVNSFHYLADGTKEVVKKVSIPPSFVPAGGVISTASDLVTWNNQLHRGKILKKSTYALMTSYNIKAQHNAFGKRDIGYGYGIRINDSEPVVEYGHTGIIPQIGFTSLNLYYPATKTTVVVLENQAYENLSIAYHFEVAIREIVKSSLSADMHYNE